MSIKAEGAALLAQGQHDQAVSELTKAIEIKPEYVEAIANRGLAY